MDFKDIIGQEHCKRALEVACVGSHNVLLIGPQQSGKSMLIDAVLGLCSEHIFITEIWPCKCGYFTDPNRECHCTPADIQEHLEGIDKQMLGQCDMQVEVPKLNYESRQSRCSQDTTQQMNQRIAEAKSRITPTDLNKEAEELLKLAILELGISPLSYDKILLVAATIAKMDNATIIEAHHISEAISYRSLDRNLWS